MEGPSQTRFLELWKEVGHATLGPEMNRPTLWLMALLVLVSSDLYAQYGAIVHAAVSEDPLTVGSAVRLLGVASGSVQPEMTEAEAADTLKRLGTWVPTQSGSSPITLGSYAYLLGQLFSLRGGAMYGLFPGPRTAFLELSRRGLLPPRARAGQTVSGADALLLLHRFMAYQGASR